MSDSWIVAVGRLEHDLQPVTVRAHKDGSATCEMGGELRPYLVRTRPTHRHRKGGLYQLLARATLDGVPVVAYAAWEDRSVWVRWASEFDQPERFQPLGMI